MPGENFSLTIQRHLIEETFLCGPCLRNPAAGGRADGADENRLEESAETLSALKARILKEGESERERIIQEARAQAQVMLESARQRIENQIRRAKGGVVSELVDVAVAVALQRLPQMLTPEDHQARIDRFTTSASQ